MPRRNKGNVQAQNARYYEKHREEILQKRKNRKYVKKVSTTKKMPKPSVNIKKFIKKFEKLEKAPTIKKMPKPSVNIKKFIKKFEKL